MTIHLYSKLNKFSHFIEFTLLHTKITVYNFVGYCHSLQLLSSELKFTLAAQKAQEIQSEQIPNFPTDNENWLKLGAFRKNKESMPQHVGKSSTSSKIFCSTLSSGTISCTLKSNVG